MEPLYYPGSGWVVMNQITTETSNFLIGPDEFTKIQVILTRLVDQSEADFAALISRGGQEIAHYGDNSSVDRTALAALAASNLAATLGIAELIDEQAFERVYHRGRQKSILMTPVGKQVFMLLVFPNALRNWNSFKAFKSSTLLLEDILSGSEDKEFGY